MLLYGSRVFGSVVKSVGYDPSDPLHVAGFELLLDLTTAADVHNSAAGVWGLGDLGSPPPETLEVLRRVVLNDDRRDPDSGRSLRAIAYRMIARIDRNAAMDLRCTEAAVEFLQDLRGWIDAAPERAFEAEGIGTEAGWLLDCEG